MTLERPNFNKQLNGIYHASACSTTQFTKRLWRNMGTSVIIDFSKLLLLKERDKRIAVYKVLRNILQKVTQNAFHLRWKRKKSAREWTFALKTNWGLKSEDLASVTLSLKLRTSRPQKNHQFEKIDFLNEF